MMKTFFATMLLAVSVAHAEYTISIENAADNSATAALVPGEMVSLNIVLTGDSTHVSNDFVINFSQGGLEYVAYEWSGNFPTGAANGDDRSMPDLADLPTVIARDTTGDANSAFDIQFTNFLSQGDFGVGMLLRIDLTVPDDFPDGTIDINPFDGAFLELFTTIVPLSGGTFILTVGTGGGTGGGDTGGGDTGGGSTADTDNDGVTDDNDAFPTDATETVDTDGDGVGDNTDAFPMDAAETTDTDSDGVGNVADTDDDGDGVVDLEDAFPLNPAEVSDTDGDGVGDIGDAFPDDPNESVDTDGDGIGNEADTDDDGDGVIDVDDAFPLDPLETTDSDGDGIGDNADVDSGNANAGPRVGGLCGMSMMISSWLILIGLTSMRFRWRRKFQH